ncbi:hypothetical protein INT45_010805 [Circinella minor]|uniref:Tc1-like transposase DDE domain-containing protein n=1 Tax=Circinella minor TaxID=1195481 RepID=A0A8H7RHW7_9FUNG|nr:hypothetical protein INT45_010805 [Circinella minor]
MNNINKRDRSMSSTNASINQSSAVQKRHRTVQEMAAGASLREMGERVPSTNVPGLERTLSNLSVEGEYSDTKEKVRQAMKEVAYGKSKKRAASDNDIPYSTFISHEERYMETGSLELRRRGPQKKKVEMNLAMHSLLLNYVDSNSVATYDEIWAVFIKKFGDEHISKESLKKYVSKHFRITLRSFKTFPQKPEGDPILRDADECLHSLYDQGVDPYRCVFVCEAAYAINFNRTYVDNKQKDWRQVKAAAMGKQYNSKMKKIKPLVPSVVSLMAASRRKVLHHTIKLLKGPTTEANVKTFLQKLILSMDVNEYSGDKWSIIFDDAPQGTQQMITEILGEHNFKAFFLPPCRTTINPLDGLFNAIAEKCPRTKMDFTNHNDGFPHRLDRAIKSTTEEELEKFFFLYFDCDCENCI